MALTLVRPTWGVEGGSWAPVGIPLRVFLVHAA